MLSGVLSGDSLTQLFRGLSQKRRHGVLEIASSEAQYEVWFQNGRIVHAENTVLPLSQAVYEKLCRAGKVSSENGEQGSKSEIGLEELYAELVEEGSVDDASFMSALNSYEYDVLYSLRDLDSGFYQFNAKIVNVHDQFSLSVAPGQLILDIVELESDNDKFIEVFEGLDSTDVVLSQLANGHVPQSEAEHVIWECLDTAKCMKEISQLTLLSEYQLKEGLISLLDNNLIAVDSRNNDEGSFAGDLSTDEVLPFVDILGDQADGEGSLSEISRDARTGSSDEGSIVEQAAEFLTTLDEHEEEDSEEGSESDWDDDDYEEEYEDEYDEYDDEHGDDEGYYEPEYVDGDFVSDIEKTSELSDGSQACSNRKNPYLVDLPVDWESKRKSVDYSTVGVTLVFLSVLALLGPTMVERFFSALVIFTSNG